MSGISGKLGTRSSAMAVLALLIAVASTTGLGAAQTTTSNNSTTTTATRRFGGDRYVGGHGVPVFRSPDEKSPVVFDAPPNVILYAEASNRAGWLKVNGIGSRQVRVRSATEDELNRLTSSVGLTSDGKLAVIQNADAERYYSIPGFVRQADIHSYEDLPADLLAATAPVPQPWKGLGVIDSRRFVVNHDVQPFDAIAQLVVPDGDKVTSCTAFFVGDPRIVVSNRHCFKGASGKDLGIHRPFSINIQHTASDLESIGGAVIAESWAGKRSGDWVIIRLNDTPKHMIVPLAFADPAKAFTAGRAKILDVGYPGDLYFGSRAAYGFVTTTLSVCDLDVSYSGVAKDGELVTQVTTCPLWHGYSGSPLLIYNNEKARFEVMGVLTLGDPRPGAYAAASFYKSLDFLSADALNKVSVAEYDEAVRLRLIHAKELADQFHSHGVLEDERTPSYASLYAAMFDDRDAAFHTAFLAPELLKSFKKALGGSIEVPDLSAANLPKSADLSQNRLKPRLDIGYDTWKGSGGLFLSGHLASDLIDNFDRASVYRSVDPQEVSSRRLLGEARAICANSCTAEVLDERYQLKTGYGVSLSPTTLKSNGTPFSYYAFAKLPDEAQYALSSKAHEGADPGFLFVGGDLFVVDPKGREVSWVVRNFMGTRADGLFGLVSENDPRCANGNLPEDAATLWVGDIPGLASQFDGFTPKSVAGATTVSPRQAACMLRSTGDRPIVLSSISYKWGIPGARSVSWASIWGAAPSDSVSTKLAAAVLALPNASRDHPIIVYCRDRDCWLSVNVVKRLVATGFTHVFWLRDGILGWMRQSAPTSAVQEIPTPLVQEDISPPPLPAVRASHSWDHVTTLDGAASVEFPGNYLNFAKTRHVGQDLVTDYAVSVEGDGSKYDKFSLKVTDFSPGGNFDPQKEVDSVFIKRAKKSIFFGHPGWIYRDHENNFSLTWIAIVEGSRLIVLCGQVADDDAGMAAGRAAVDRFASSLTIH